MKNVFVVMSGDSRVCSFEERPHAYAVRGMLDTEEFDGYLHVDKQIVFEGVSEWEQLGN
jgi:hypothetical protein